MIIYDFGGELCLDHVSEERIVGDKRTLWVNGIEVVNCIKYLGVLIDNKLDCFKSQKEKTIKNALIYRNQIFSILGNCYNRMLVGKRTFFA